MTFRARWILTDSDRPDLANDFCKRSADVPRGRIRPPPTPGERSESRGASVRSREVCQESEEGQKCFAPLGAAGVHPDLGGGDEGETSGRFKPDIFIIFI